MTCQLNGWTISYNPPPIPDRRWDWSFVHKDYDADDDGDNGLGGCAGSVEECLNEIALIEAEHPHFQTEAR